MFGTAPGASYGDWLFKRPKIYRGGAVPVTIRTMLKLDVGRKNHPRRAAGLWPTQTQRDEGPWAPFANVPSARSPLRRRCRSARVSPLIPVAALALAGAALAAVWLPRLYARHSTLAALEASDPQARKAAAWAVAETSIEPAVVAIRGTLLAAAEPNPDVREAFVYALGHAGSPADFELLRDLAANDPSGYVRQAALLAATRVAPGRCRELLATKRSPETARTGASRPDHAADPWDTLAAAQARLALGDAAGVPALLDIARHAQPSQRQVACRALHKWLRPALVAAGRWPLEAAVRPGEIWPAGLLDEIARRCGELDLGQLLRQARAQEQKAEPIRRNTGRWTGARERLVRMLFSEDGG